VDSGRDPLVKRVTGLAPSGFDDRRMDRPKRDASVVYLAGPTRSSMAVRFV
jgi:hypothetical protein